MGMLELFAACADRHGVVTAAAGPPHGVPRSTVRTRAIRESWPSLHPGTWVVPGREPTSAARAFAAAMSVGGEVAITGWSALAHHGLLRSWPTTTELLVRDRHRRLLLERVETRWTDRWPSAFDEVGGVRITTVARSLAQCAGQLELVGARRIALDAASRGLLDAVALDAELDARGRFAGRGLIRRLRQDLVGDGSESGFEFEARERFTQLGLRPLRDQPVVAVEGGTRRIDIAFPGEVGVECHSLAHHASVADLERDARRRNELAELDRWLLLDLTMRTFHLDLDAFVARLRRCLARRGSPR
jgi:hypothetical protein